MFDDFKAVMRAAGLEPPEHLETSGSLVRFDIYAKGDKAGWYIFHADGVPAGQFGNWKTLLSEKWCGKAQQAMTEAELAEHRRFNERAKAQREAQRLADQQQAATKAAAILSGAGGDPKGHLYALTKKVPFGPLVKRGPWAQRGWPDALLIPLFEESGTIVSVQAISANLSDKKDFLFGGRKKGCFHPLGKFRGATGRVLVGEGLATVAAAVAATGLPGVVAFDAGNLLHVAEIVRKLAPEAEIVALADDDRKPDTDHNLGIEAATKAALAVGGAVAVPGLGKKADFWDLWSEQGADAVRQAIEAAALVMDQSKAVAVEANQVQPPAGDQERGAPPAGGSDRVRPVGIHEFLSFEFPPRENLLSPWLPSQGLAMVYAARGIGKTHFALGVAYAVASGGRYLGWESPTPAGVLYIDGEMPGAVMQERLAAIAASCDLEPVAPFEILNPDLQPNGMPRIDTPEGQAAIEAILTPAIKLIVVDNISTLTQTKENEADGWTPVQAWALRQRSIGRSVLFVHHAGKGGQQRGTSRREDVLDTVISLRRPVDYNPDQGAVFEIHFEKARGIYGDDVKPIEASLTTTEAGLIAWATRTVEAGTFDRVVQLLNDGMKQHEIAVELGLNKSTISRHVKKAKAEGLAVAA